jgi:hypothetical protein
MDRLFLVAVLVVPVVAILALWLVFELVRRLSAGSREDRGRVRCGWCDRWTDAGRPRCDWCGRTVLAQNTAKPSELADLAATERQLQRMHEGGLLTPAEVAVLLDRIRLYRSRLSSAPAPELVEVEVVEEPAPPRAPPMPVPAKPKAVVPPVPVPAKPRAIVPPVSAPAKPRAAVQPVAPAVAAAKPQPAAPQPPAPPRRSWTEVLSAFMEDRNIRIGELVGGLLFVVFSVLLVVNLWGQISKNQYYQFFILTAVSASVFGVGLYARHRWRLESTGLSLLVIATLLVPLNFLIMVGITRTGWDWTALVAEVISIGLFAGLVYQAARVLVPGGPWHQVVALLGNSAAMLVTGRLAGPEMTAWQFLAIGCAPVLLFAGPVGCYLWRLPRRRQLDVPATAALFTLLGTATFAVLGPLGLLVYQAAGGEAAGLPAALDRISVLVAAAAVPILAGGLSAMRGTTRDKALGPYRTAGTVVALLAPVVMLAALGLAWPMPSQMTAVSLLSAGALLVAAFRYRMPVLHAGVIAFATAAYLTGFHLLRHYSEIAQMSREELARDMVQRLLHALTATGSAQSGMALVGLCAVLGLAAEMLARGGLRRHGLAYTRGAVVVALLSLGLVTLPGLLREQDAMRATIVYAVYGAAGLALNARWRREAISYVGLGLLVGATLWGLRWLTGDLHPAWAQGLASEALVLCIFGAVAARRSDHTGPLSLWERGMDVYRRPLWHVGEVVAGLALGAGLSTAWHFRDEVFASSQPTLFLAAVCLAAAWSLLAWTYRSPERTWTASLIALAGVIHLLTCSHPALVGLPWLVALLSHATAAGVAGLALDFWFRRRSDQGLASDLRRVFVEPLGGSALFSSALVLPSLPFAWDPSAGTLALALCLLWLAGIWLALAWTNRWPAMLSAHQGVLAAAVVAATTAWLESQQVPWPDDLLLVLLDARYPQAYGIALGVLCLAWIGLRIALRGSRRVQRLLDAPWPAVDWLLLHTLVAAQLALLAVHLLFGCYEELIGGKPGRSDDAFGLGAWGLLATLAVALVATLWHRWRRAEMVGSLLVAVSLACLLAGRWTPDLAVASALRWWLAAACVACSAVVWQRHRLAAWAVAARPRVELQPGTHRLARATLLVTAALPVLGVTLIAALLELVGAAAERPALDVFFHQIPLTVSYLVPLLLVMAGMVGYALRDRSAGYAFSAGLVAEMAVVLGYPLNVLLAGDTFETAESATLVQLATITAAVWAGIWLAARRYVGVWRETGRQAAAARSLMDLQIGMGLVGNMVLLVPALLTFALSLPPWSDHWVIAAGQPLGWIALVLFAAVAAWRRVEVGRRIRPETAGLLGMAALALLACTVQGLTQVFLQDSPWGYRALMLGWASYALFTVAATWWVATVRTLPGAQGPPQVLVRAAAVWVALAGGLAVLLGVKAALFHSGRVALPWAADELLWAAAAIAIASGAGATMAFWRRAEDWAFGAALGVNLAASLVVWYFQRTIPFVAWWLLLVQANVIATAAVALVWLAARRRLYALRELSIRTSPLLGVQVTLAAAGNAVVLALPVLSLLGTPSSLPSWAGQLATPAGWAALLLGGMAAKWYLIETAPRNVFHVGGAMALALPVMLTCYTAQGRLPLDLGPWASYHVLLTLLSVGGLLLLAAGMTVRKYVSSPWLAAVPSSATIQAWVAWIGAIVVALSLLWSLHDAGGAWWRARAILSVSVATGLLAMWLRRPGYVYVSGLLLNAAGTLLGLAVGHATAVGLAEVNIFCLAAGATIWAILRGVHREGVPSPVLDDRPLPFAHAAAVVGLGALCALAAVFFFRTLNPPRLDEIDALGWTALGAVAAALLVHLWDRTARFPLAGLYVLVLASLAFIHHFRAWSPWGTTWAIASELPAFVLVAAAAGWVLPRARPVWRALRIPEEPGRWSADWFVYVQFALTAVGAVMAAWIAIDFDFEGVMADKARLGMGGRIAAIAGALMLLGTAVVMASHRERPGRRGWHFAGFASGALLQCTIGWSTLSTEATAPWLHRSVTLMVAAALMTYLSSMGLRKIVPAARDWAASGRKISPALGALALVALAGVMAQEVYWYDHPGGVPLGLTETLIVAAALVGLIATGLALAVVPDLDPLGLSERGRTVYVYVAEALLLLVCLHVGLTLPHLFHSGIVRRYWMLIVMGVAFVGAGLSEWFHRRRMPVLSEPFEWTAFLLPIVPAAAFWFPVAGIPSLGIAGPSPAVWLLIGAFYSICAYLRRPAGTALPSALAVAAFNMGLWVLWTRLDIGLTDRPQLWIIPVGLCVLVAEFLNHDRLTSAQSGAVRYLALSLIYVSSTVDMVLTGIENNIWLPLVLMFLSVAGILLGILLRVRSFLVLGLTFLMVLMLTMLKYAAYDLGQMWTLYACGVLTAAAIIALFAVFEKRRNDILRAAEKFKRWER